VDELDQSDFLDQSDLISKLQKIGNNKNNFYNDESIDFDKSIVEENDFYVDDEA
jgi:hypothetical protein